MSYKAALLSQTEVVELSGYKQQSKQARWLRDHGFMFEIGGDGKIKILRRHVEEKLNPSTKKPRKAEPDFSILGERYGQKKNQRQAPSNEMEA